MSQRDSGYARKDRDTYETPPWVTRALLPHLPPSIKTIWEPAAGSGQMVRTLEGAGYNVTATDITTGTDFLTCAAVNADAIITNPPYVLARGFIERGLELAGVVGMLLRTDYDHAASRTHLFGGCTAFTKKLVLTKRIIWFDGPKAAPSFNHAWYLWDRQHSGPAVIAYA